MPADVGLRERVEIASLQREILDHGPVKGPYLLTKHGEGGFEEIHGYIALA